MTDSPTDPREAAGLIPRMRAGLVPAELLDGKPEPRTAWVAIEAIDGVGKVTTVTQFGLGRRIGVFTLTLRGGQTVECSDTESTSEPTSVNLARTAARREAILDLWAAARLKARGQETRKEPIAAPPERREKTLAETADDIRLRVLRLVQEAETAGLRVGLFVPSKEAPGGATLALVDAGRLSVSVPSLNVPTL